MQIFADEQALTVKRISMMAMCQSIARRFFRLFPTQREDLVSVAYLAMCEASWSVFTGEKELPDEVALDNYVASCVFGSIKDYIYYDKVVRPYKKGELELQIEQYEDANEAQAPLIMKQLTDYELVDYLRWVGARPIEMKIALLSFEGYTKEEIREIIKIPISTIYSKMERLRRKWLQKILQGD